MKKTTLLLIALALLVNLGFSQSTKNFINTNDRSAKIEPLQKNPEKLSKIIWENKIKTTFKEKNVIVSNHKITFYTTAFYKYKETGDAGKVGQRVGFALSGVSDQTFQEITDETNNYLLQKLKETGYTIDDYNKFTAAKKYAKLKEKSSKPGVEEEMQNLYLTKKVKAKTFTAGKHMVHPPIVGNTMHFGLLKDTKATEVVSSFKINFLSIGHEVSNSSTVSTWVTNYGIETEECLYGSASLEFLTPKMKFGTVSTKNFYRHENLMSYTVTEEITEDGFIIIKADEAQYKKNAIELVNTYIDLMFKRMKEVEEK